MNLERFLKTERPYLTDGGLETFMVFFKGYELPCFSSHVLLLTDEGRAALSVYYKSFIELAEKTRRGYMLGTESWRLNSAWAPELGLSEAEMLLMNERAVEFAKSIRIQNQALDVPIVLNGIVGPLGDGYVIDQLRSVTEAMDAHRPQVHCLAKAGVEMISGLTLSYSAEAIGIANVAREVDCPVVISFTVETDGCLPSGETLAEAILAVDAATGLYPLYYMINCAHPDHFNGVMTGSDDWKARIGGIRANASRRSHAELDEAEELDAGDPVELGEQYVELQKLLPSLKVMGGCCGTDHRHISCIAES